MEVKVIANGTVLTLNNRGDVLSPGVVIVEGERIVEVSEWDQESLERLSKVYPTMEFVDASGCVVMPGLVNAHTHAPMTIFRGLADDLPLKEWLENHIFPAEKHLTEDMVFWGTMLACAEMITSGTTTFCDMYLFEHKVAEAVDRAGLRAVVGEVIYDFPSPHYGELKNGFAFTKRFIEEWKGHERIKISVDPHTVYTCSPEVLLESFSIAEQYDVPIVIHLAETEEEVRESFRRYLKSPVKHLADLGILTGRVIADHCVWLSEEDRDLLAKGDVKVVHNPESNLKLASGISPVVELLRRGITISLGTDGCASNNDLDMFSEMDTCAKLHKGTVRDPTVLPARTVLKMATTEGAKTLGLDGFVGKIEVGMLGDIIVLDFNKPHLVPCYDPISHIVYSARGSDVRDVMVHGRWLMKNRGLITIDFDEVKFYVTKISKRFRSS
ncbi:MAG: amidohydrolase [Syntrophobacterales bacterium]|nr:amidohydrolase [Syntrophobacterales bacterium]